MDGSVYNGGAEEPLLRAPRASEKPKPKPKLNPGAGEMPVPEAQARGSTA